MIALGRALKENEVAQAQATPDAEENGALHRRSRDRGAHP